MAYGLKQALTGVPLAAGRCRQVSSASLRACVSYGLKQALTQAAPPAAGDEREPQGQDVTSSGAPSTHHHRHQGKGHERHLSASPARERAVVSTELQQDLSKTPGAARRARM